MRIMTIASCLLLAAGLAAAQTPSTSKGTMSLNLSLTDDNGIDAVTEIITLKNIRASEIEPFIRARLSRYGAVQVNDALNMLIVTDKQPKVRDLVSIVLKLDAAGITDFLRLETEAIRLQYVQPSVIKPYLDKRLSTEGSIEANDTLNLLIITDLKSSIAAIKKLLPQLDIMPRQVAVEFKIFDITNLTSSTTGFDWFEIMQHTQSGYRYSTQSGDTRSTNLNEQTNQPPYGNRYESQGRSVDRAFYVSADAAQVLRYIEQTAIANHITLVSNPIILVQNRSAGSISSSVNYPYDGGNERLTVSALPNISESSTVGLKVTVQLSSGQISTANCALASEMTVAAGQPVIIGKATQTTEQKSRKGLPGLKDIPLLGYLFGRNVVSTEIHQLLVFAIPHIIEPGQGIADTTQIKDNK